MAECLNENCGMGFVSISITVVLISEMMSLPHEENGEITILQPDCAWLHGGI